MHHEGGVWHGFSLAFQREKHQYSISSIIEAAVPFGTAKEYAWEQQ
jgi:hypothetical protein